MLLMVGLGNPGAKYAGNRHNIGFMALDRIAADHGFSPWKARFQGLVAEGRLGENRVTLLKPQTFMNLSGQSVGEAMRYLKLTPAEVVVLHDELDLAPGTCRLKTGGGHAGHNGLRSIHQHIRQGRGGDGRGPAARHLGRCRGAGAGRRRSLRHGAGGPCRAAQGEARRTAGGPRGGTRARPAA